MSEAQFHKFFCLAVVLGLGACDVQVQKMSGGGTPTPTEDNAQDNEGSDDPTNVDIPNIITPVKIVAAKANYFVVADAGTRDAKHLSMGDFNAKKFKAGDVIAFQSGVTYTGNFCVHSDGSPTALKPVVITSTDATKPAVIKSGGSSNCLDYVYVGNAAIGIYNESNMEVRDLHLVGVGADNGVAFIGRNANYSHWVVDNVEAEGFGIGVQLVASNAQLKQLALTSVNLHDNRQGMSAANVKACDTDMHFFGLHVDKSIVTQNKAGGIVLQYVDGAVIENSEISYNGFGGDSSVGLLSSQSRNLLVQHNEVHHQGTADGSDGDGIDFDWGTTDSIAQYNFTHDNYGSGLIVCDLDRKWPSTRNVFRYNILVNDARRNDYGAIKLSSFAANGQGEAACSHQARSTSDAPTTAEVYQNTVYLNNEGLSESNAPKNTSAEKNHPRASGTPATITLKQGSGELWSAKIANNLLIVDNSKASYQVPFVKYESSNSTNVYVLAGNAYWTLNRGLRLEGQNEVANAKAGLQGISGANDDEQNKSDSYRMQAATAAIYGAGVGLSTLKINSSDVTKDYFGRAIPTNRSDIGASAW